MFEGRVTALKNRFNRFYSLGIYFPDNRNLKRLLWPGAAPFKRAEIKVPEYSEKTLFRDAEKVAKAKIGNLARRFDCDVIVLENERINGSDPLNPDFNEDEKPRSYSVVACFYGSKDYLNRHQDSSRQRLVQRVA